MTNQAEQTMPLPPYLPEWSGMDNLGGVVPSEVRQALIAMYQQGYAAALSQTAGVTYFDAQRVAEEYGLDYNKFCAAHRAMLAAAPVASATSKTYDRCTDPENCKRCSEDASTPHAGIPHAAPAASGVDTSTNEAWAARAQEKIAAMDAGASVSERAPLLAIIAEAIRNAERHPRQQYGLNLATLRALEQALTQQRGVREAAEAFLEAADARDNEETLTQYPEHERRLRQYKAAREELESLLGRGGA